MEKFLINSLAVESPELCLDWHPIKNLPLTITNVSIGSSRKVWWQCHKCNHEWQAHISNRRKQHKYPGQPGTACPNCIGRVINSNNSFANANPEIIEEWHPSKNVPNTTYNVAPCSKRKYSWICKKCKYEWKTTCSSRTGGSGCPVCGFTKNRKVNIKSKIGK